MTAAHFLGPCSLLQSCSIQIRLHGTDTVKCSYLHHFASYLPLPIPKITAWCSLSNPGPVGWCFSPATRHAPPLGHQENKWKKQFEIAKKQAFSEGVLWRPMGMPKVLGRAPTERTSKVCIYIYIYIYISVCVWLTWMCMLLSFCPKNTGWRS